MPDRLFYIMSLCHVTGKPKLIFFSSVIENTSKLTCPYISEQFVRSLAVLGLQRMFLMW